MVERIRSISEATLIPISLVIMIIGGASWLTTVYVETKNNGVTIAEASQDIKIVQNKQDEYNRSLQKIDERLSRIEGKLGIDIRGE